MNVSVVDGKAYSLLVEDNRIFEEEAAKAQVNQQGTSVSVRLSAASTSKILGKNKFIWGAAVGEADPGADPNDKKAYYGWLDYSPTKDQESGTDDYFHHPAP